MKNSFLKVLLFAAALALVGCQKEEGESGLDLTKVQAAFATSGDSIVKLEWDKVVTAVKAQDWVAAGSALKQLAADAKLNDEQKEALKDLAEEIQVQAAKLADKAKKAVGNAAEQATKLANQAKDSATKAVSDLESKK